MATELDIAKTRILRRLLRINGNLVQAGVSGDVQALIDLCLNELDRLAGPVLPNDELRHRHEAACEAWLLALHRRWNEIPDDARSDIARAADRLESVAHDALRAAAMKHLIHVSRIEQLEARVRDLTEAAEGG